MDNHNWYNTPQMELLQIQNLDKFWALVIHVWKHGIGGIDVSKTIISLLIITSFLVFRGLFSQVIIVWLKAIAKRTESKIDDDIVEALAPTIKLIPVVFGIFFAGQYMELNGISAEIADNLVRSISAFTIFWGAYRIIEPLSFLLSKLASIFTEELIDWLVKAIKLTVFLIGTATVLQVWGIQVGPIIAGAGLFGVAIALGSQDLFKNLIGGILILGEKRFRKGHWICVEEVVEGTVERIGFRSTMVRRFDKALVMVPNAKLADTAVINFSMMSHRRIYWTISVEYKTTIEQLKKIREKIEGYILDNEEFELPSKVSTFVRIENFSDSSIDIMLYCFTKTTNWGDWLEIKESLAYRIKEIVENSGTNFAFPSQSIYVESITAERPEVFRPPPTDKKP